MERHGRRLFRSYLRALPGLAHLLASLNKELYPNEAARTTVAGAAVAVARSPEPAGPARSTFPWHWLPIAVFVLYTALNMLDRQLLAAVAPMLKKEFYLSNAQYGALVSVFYAVSTAVSPLAGLFIDRVGLNLGASLAIAIWSLAGAATGWTQTLRGLTLSRFGLGLGESGGSSAQGATLAHYMDAGELGLGAALLGLGTSLGAIAAPLMVAALSPRHGWRSVFLVCGVLGLLWLPLWWTVSKLIPPRFKTSPRARMPFRELLLDRRFWGVALAYALAKQTLWVSWTTIYFVQERHLTMVEANQKFSWFPAVFGGLGALVVGASRCAGSGGAWAGWQRGYGRVGFCRPCCWRPRRFLSFPRPDSRLSPWA